MPRKTTGCRRPGPSSTDASMRPRPDAAENAERAERAERAAAASMRPRPDAAENVERRQPHVERPDASMRPRPDAAENPASDFSPPIPVARFNEAAARCRGKHPGHRRLRRRDDASMRPARKGPENEDVVAEPASGDDRASMRPARKGPENSISGSGGAGAGGGFNEAGPQGAGKRARAPCTNCGKSTLQ